jgi:trigger factor
VQLARTEGFRVTRQQNQVTDETVEEQLEHMREQRATWTPVEDKPMPGDMVTVELATADEEGEIPEGKEYRLVLGEGQAIPGIEELVMELDPGQTLERAVRWPEDFPDEEQRGKTKPVRVLLKDVKRKAMPALDDAFAREVGDFDSIEALQTTIRKDLEEQAVREAESGARSQLLDQIIEANPFDVPPSWVSQMVEAYMQAYRIPDEEKERFAGEFRSVAERQVRRDVVIDTLAAKESLAATEADIDDRVAEIASTRGADPAQVYASLQKAGRLKEMEHSITEEKVFKWLLERNTVE